MQARSRPSPQRRLLLAAWSCLAATRCPDLDLDRVAIRGWSFGGVLAAGVVLRRPEGFHAAVAGAPTVDQQLYNTHWKERYLSHPDVGARKSVVGTELRGLRCVWSGRGMVTPTVSLWSGAKASASSATTSRRCARLLESTEVVT